MEVAAAAEKAVTI